MSGDMVIGFVAGFVLGPPIILGLMVVINYLVESHMKPDYAEDYYSKMTEVTANDILADLEKRKNDPIK